MNKIVLFIIFFSLILLQLWAVPANPNVINFTQSDGTSLEMYQKGDEFVHWSETVDGYTVLNNGNNTYYYAMLDSRSDMGRSEIQAHNISQRSAEEIVFLSTINKQYSFSKSQIDMFKDTILKFTNRGSRAFPTTGTNNLLMILANFNNTSTTYTQLNFNNYMNQVNYNGTGSFKDFYLECSYGQLTLNTTVTSWVTVPNSHNYYGPDANWGEFAYHSVQAADSIVEIDFSDYDNDGDGTVDGIAIIHQGPGQEATGSTNDIWSHSWDLASAGYSSAQRTFDGVLVSSYTTQPETGSGGEMATIGVMCHEFGHNLGAPDYYDTDYGTGGQYDGMGNWCVMASGSYNGSGGDKPAHHNGFTKWHYYGWCIPTFLSSGTNVSMGNSVYNSTDFYYYITTTSNEYFFLENRQQTGFDSGLPGHGLLILHADQDYIDLHDGTNDINASSHQGLYPKAAEGTINASSCPFPGTSGNTSFTDTTTPDSQSWASANTNKPITNIQEIGDVLSFGFMSIADIAVNPTSFSENLGLNQTGQQTLTIANDGESGSSLSYNIFKQASARGSSGLDPETSKSNTRKQKKDPFINTSRAYCHTSYSNTSDDWITNVLFNTINNSSGSVGYEDYTAISTDLTPGSSYDLDVDIQVEGSWEQHCWAWIDWNQNDILDDTGEAYDLGDNGSVSGAHQFSKIIDVPVDALPGSTRMRVSERYSDNPEPCTEATYGEAEDYSVNIVTDPSLNWLTFDGGHGVSGSILGGNPDINIIVGFNSADLAVGVYEADVVISSDDPDESTIIVPVSLTVNDNSSSGSGTNPGGNPANPVVIVLPPVIFNEIPVNPEVSVVDNGGLMPLSVDVTISEDVQSETPVPNPEAIQISYDIQLTGDIIGLTANFDLCYDGLSGFSNILWYNGSTWLVPDNVQWGNPSTGHVTFSITFSSGRGSRDGSTEIILGDDNPLPVTLSSLQATFINQNAVLQWITQSETQNAGWNVYRAESSNSGQRLKINADLIPGAGTTSEPTEYSFTDQEYVVSEHTYWYWLESFAASGDVDEYGPIALTIPYNENNIPQIPDITLLKTNYPNPFNPTTSISFNVMTDEEAELSIYNLKGQKLLKENFQPGSYNFHWNASEYGTGIYFYKLSSDSYECMKKMLMMK